MNRGIWLVITILTVVITLFSCRREPLGIVEFLERQDSLLQENPMQVYDSLLSVESYELTERNEAYFNLLLTIAEERIGFNVDSDSIISLASRYYIRNGNKQQIVRALYYHGLTRFRIDGRDSLAFNYIKQAEILFRRYHIDNSRLGEQLYTGLFRVHRRMWNDKLALLYGKKALDYCISTGKSDNEIDLRFNLIRIGIEQREEKEARQHLLALQKFHLDGRQLSLLNQCFGDYYAMTDSVSKSITYYKQALSGANRDRRMENKINRDIAEGYERLSYSDSAQIYFCRIERKKDHPDRGGEGRMRRGHRRQLSEHFDDEERHYIDYAKALYAKHNFQEAADYYASAYDYLAERTEEKLRSKSMEIDRKYDLEEKENELTEQRLIRWLILFVTLFVFTLFASLAWNMVRNQKNHNRRLKESIEHIRFITNIYTNVLSHNVQMEEELKNMVNMAHKNNDSLGKEVDRLLRKSKCNTKLHLSALVDMGNVNSIPEISDKLSDSEKLLLTLYLLHFTSVQISEILHSTPESMYVRKSNLKAKLQNMDIQNEEIRAIFR